MKFVYPKGATPINLDEARDLIPPGVTTQTELDQLEQANIVLAESWAFRRKHKDWLTVSFVRRLHQKMFSGVWRWAGKFRLTNKNLGVDKSQIQEELQKLIGDSQFWIDRETFPRDELAVRFHHRLVSIHPFPNGNGRHARLMADILLFQIDQERFSWGSSPITPEGETRTRYLEALQSADRGDFEKLLRFVRS